MGRVLLHWRGVLDAVAVIAMGLVARCCRPERALLCSVQPASACLAVQWVCRGLDDSDRGRRISRELAAGAGSDDHPAQLLAAQRRQLQSRQSLLGGAPYV